MRDHPKRGEIYWIKLDPTMGTETKKTRPCLILSNNSQNKKGLRIIAAPITSNVSFIYPFESKIILKGRECKILLDQIRALDFKRIGSKIDSIDHYALALAEEALLIALALKKN